MNPYPHYKPTGIDWIGEIPETWDRTTLKHVLEIKITDGPHTTPEFLPEGIPFLSAEAIKDNKLDFNARRGNISRALFEEYNQKSEVKKNDILFCKSGSTTGKSALVETGEEFAIWSPLAIIRADRKKIDQKFLFHYIQSREFQTQVQVFWSFGTQPNIGMSTLENLYVSFPLNIDEQTAIANYLDQKTAQIDKLIANKQKLIELLKEERAGIINQAVIRGLNPKARLRPSGMEWVGDIPAHWEMKKLSHGFGKIGSGTTPSSGDQEYYLDGEINWLQTGDLKDGDIFYTSKKITKKALQDFSALKFFKPNSIVMAMYGATIGKMGILRIETTTNQACCVLSEPKSFIPEYAFYWFIAKRNHIISLSYGGGQPNISQTIISSIRIHCPPKEEQNEIIEYITNENHKMDATLVKIEKEIELMQEYRTALISEVVTGKVKV